MKAKTKHTVNKAVSAISDLVISASGLHETIDVKMLIADFFVYARFLFLNLQKDIVRISSCIRTFAMKYNIELIYTMFIVVYIAFILHLATIAVLLLLLMIVLASLYIKNEAARHQVTNKLPE